MNIITIFLVIIGGSIGFITTAYLVVSLIAVLGYKIYRKVRYRASLYD